jgi:quinol monooxygenase YgiN
MSGVRLVINMSARPGEAQNYINAWNPQHDEVNAEPGCLQYELFQSTTNPENLTLLEWWATEEDFNRHVKVQQGRVPVGAEFLGRSADRAVGQNTSEVYWDQKSYRFDPASEAWVPFEPRPAASR